MMVANVRGEFSKVAAIVVSRSDAPENARVEAHIDAPVSTRGRTTQPHLKRRLSGRGEVSGDHVRLKKITGSDGEWKVTGDLTIHGVTREVTLAVEGPAPEMKDPWGNVKSGASAVTKINRKDFGLVWNVALESGGLLVGEEDTITLEVELLRS
jgi:polyisoprenoid-binding protein YceI